MLSIIETQLVKRVGFDISQAQNATRVIDRWRMGYLAEMENSLQQLTTIVTGTTGLQRRVALLERNIDMNSTIRTGNRSRIPVRMRNIESTACDDIFFYIPVANYTSVPIKKGTRVISCRTI